ncbi:MAG: hypothetical protein JWN94_1424 [Betaproteobacteria bacterium]|nr:hypothetical protein [Betaproteobacteria bacterium]
MGRSDLTPSPSPSYWQRLRAWARELKTETLTLWFCCKNPATPFAAKVLATLVVAYALSPIDLIPDFIPVIGYLDDVILIPIGIYFTLKLIPQPIIEASRIRAREWMAASQVKPRNYVAAAMIVCLWLAAAWWAWRWYTAET